MNIVFRLAQLNDLNKIVAIYNSTIASKMVTADLQAITPQQRLTWLQQHLSDAQRPIYVIEINNEIDAWGSLSDYYPRAAYRITAEISIYVAKHARSQGLGQMMLDNIITIAPELGIQNLIAVIFAHNLPSLKLFERNGFQTWGRLPQVCDLQTQLADVLILGKHLSGSLKSS